MKKPLVFAALCWYGSPNAAHAQTSFSIGPRVGLNVATATYNDPNGGQYNYTTLSIASVETGIVASFSSSHIAIQPALLYSQKGFLLDGSLQQIVNGQTGFSSFHIKHSLNYLTVPLNMVYSQKTDGEGFQGFAGGYLGVLVGGHVKYDNHQGVVGITDNYYQADLPVRAGKDYQADEHFHSRRFDAGLQAGAGYSHQGILVQVTYSLGLSNLGVDYPMNPSPEGPNYRSRTLSISLTYLASPNRCKKKQRLNEKNE